MRMKGTNIEAFKHVQTVFNLIMSEKFTFPTY